MVVIKFYNFSLSQARSTSKPAGIYPAALDPAGQNPSLTGIPPWVAFMLEPWLAAIQRVGPGSTSWLHETSAAMSECIREWVDLTPEIEVALEDACIATELLAAVIDEETSGNTAAQREFANAAMTALIEALRDIEPCGEKAGLALSG